MSPDRRAAARSRAPAPGLQRRQWLVLAAAGAGSLGNGALAAPVSLAPKTIRIFGANISHVELGQRGSKPTLVLLHGLGSSAIGDWGQVLRPLAETHHVLALDQLGFGQSDKPAISYGIQTWVDMLGEFLREKKVDAFTLVGASLGGWIAAQYTLQALRGDAIGVSFALPKPTRLVLCNAAGFAETFAAMLVNRSLGTPPLSLAGEKALLGQVFHAPVFSNEQAVRNGMAWSLGKGDTQTVAAVLGNPKLADEAIDGLLFGITVPTLVVWGEQDRLIPVALGRRFAAEIPGARLVVVPDTGHAPMIETPNAFMNAVKPFLKP